MVQWLRLRALNAGGLGLTPDQETRSPHAALKILCDATKIEDPDSRN